MRKKTVRSMAQGMGELATLVANLREEEVLLAIKQYLAAGVSPAEILQACQKGMRLVGSMHEKGHYYIAGLIMAGEIMREAVDLVKPVMVRQRRGKTFGRVLWEPLQATSTTSERTCLEISWNATALPSWTLGLTSPRLISLQPNQSSSLI